MKKLLFVFQLLFVALLSQAQFVISGKVTDVDGNKLAGANVQLEHSPKGTVTDLQGCYQLEVNKIGNYTLTASFLGFTKLQETVEVTKNLELNFTLTAKSILADEKKILNVIKSELKEIKDKFDRGHLNEQINKVKEFAFKIINVIFKRSAFLAHHFHHLRYFIAFV